MRKCRLRGVTVIRERTLTRPTGPNDISLCIPDDIAIYLRGAVYAPWPLIKPAGGR